MTDLVEVWEYPQSKRIDMIAGWRQWADAGSTSSGLPQYLIKQTKARQIGTIPPDSYYLFQIPGTHDLVRPVVKFEDGFPESLEARRNELFYTGDEEQGVVFFLGDEPHLNAERYVSALLEAAQSLKVQRIVGLGGVYGELPYDKERIISSIYSKPKLKDELENLAVNFSDYHGGASIGSYICRRAADKGMEYVSFYAFVPLYDFSNFVQAGNTIRIENDYMAWLGIVRRINAMLHTRFSLSDLEEKSEYLVHTIDAKIDELETKAPRSGVRDFLERLSDAFTEVTFDPLSDVWEDELRRLLDDDAPEG